MSEPAIHHGDCLDVLATLPDASVDAVVTDPPYGLEFMGKEWDSFKTYAGGNPNMKPQGASIEATAEGDWQPGRAYGSRQKNPRCRRCGKLSRGNGCCKCPEPQWDTRTAEGANQYQFWCQEWAEEVWRVLKPGGHMLAFGGTRTFHRLACAVEDAGFEVRDSIAWLYGSGFPKSLDVSKAIDKAAGAEREVIREWPQTYSGGAGEDAGYRPRNYIGQETSREPATDDARTWQGWGTALKPAFEPIVVARKPLAGTVAANVLAHGTGALNVDGCRVAHRDAADLAESAGKNRHADFGSGPRENKVYGADNRARGENGNYDGSRGRWPSNVVLDESQAEALDAQSGKLTVTGNRTERSQDAEVDGTQWLSSNHRSTEYPGETPGGASRFFYTAKAAADERVRVNGTAHPTVKPLALMRWLVRLVTPPGGTVLDPFAGSGTTVEAAILEGFDCIAIEREADYLPLIQQRIHRRRDPVAAVRATLEDAGLFDLIDTPSEEPA